MKKGEKIYIVLWVLLLIVSLILVFTLPSIWMYYTGFINIKPGDIGIPQEVVDILTRGINIVDNVFPNHLKVTDIAKMALSYMTAYVPADFPENNLPVKFWATVVFLVLMFIGNLVIVLYSLRKIKTEDDAFFNIPIIGQSIFCLIVSVAISLMCVISDKIYYVMAIVAYIILIIISLFIFFGVTLLKDYISGVKTENKGKKQFLKEVQIELELLVNKLKNKDCIDKLLKLNEEIKYYDSVSNTNLIDIENKIKNEIANINTLISEDNNKDIGVQIDKLTSMLNERNILCKKYK